jgi:hypothetical protein
MFPMRQRGQCWRRMSPNVENLGTVAMMTRQLDRTSKNYANRWLGGALDTHSRTD